MEIASDEDAKDKIEIARDKGGGNRCYSLRCSRLEQACRFESYQAKQEDKVKLRIEKQKTKQMELELKLAKERRKSKARGKSDVDVDDP